MPSAPFDSVATEYDVAFTEHRLGRWLRAAVWDHLDTAFRPSDRVLELGCGTGEDAIHLARRGVRVHATDVSTTMLDVARHKAEVEGVAPYIAFTPLDLTTPTLPYPHTPIPPYDGAFSNFGALNSLSTLPSLTTALARWVRPGGRVVLVVMGPWCPWEWGWYLAHGNVRTAFRRLRHGGIAHVGHGATMRVWYPSPRRLRRAMAPYFVHRQTVGVGVLLPPTFAHGLVDRHPGLFERIAALDRKAGRFFPGTWLNDHYLTLFERTDREVHDA